MAIIVTIATTIAYRPFCLLSQPNYSESFHCFRFQPVSPLLSPPHAFTTPLQLRQLKIPPNSLLHVQITLRLARKKGQTHTEWEREGEGEKKPCQFSIPIGQTHIVRVWVRRNGEAGHNSCRPVFIFFIGQHSFQLRLLTHTLNTCHKLAKKENRGTAARSLISPLLLHLPPPF